MTYRRTRILVAGVTLVAGAIGAFAFAKESDRPVKRAHPPKWSADVLDAFFEDARTKLVGNRPEYEATVAAVGSNPTVTQGNDTSATTQADGWSKLIDAETIETEIKRVAQSVSKLVSTPTEFKGGAFEDCRREFSELALLFAVAAEYDGEVRWQESAAGLRDLFSRAGHNCKVGTDQTFNESKLRKQDLTDLVSGSRPKLPKADAENVWGQVADRPPLMQRMEIAHQERLTKWVANPKEFEKNRDEVRHEAQLMAAIADVVSREGFDYWDDEEYAKHVRALRQAAIDVAAAVELDNYEQAQKAVNQATKACADCHELYRG